MDKFITKKFKIKPTENSDEEEAPSSANNKAETSQNIKRKIRSEWLTTFEWLQEKDGSAFCVACSKPLTTHLSHLKSHEKTALHVQNYATQKKTLKIQTFFNNEQKKKADQVKNVEFTLVMFCITHNLPFLLMDYLPALLVECCPDSAIAKLVHCGRTKATETAENIAIGYGRIANINTKTVSNKIRSNCLALYILAIGGNTRFEFLFTDVSGETERKNMPIFQSVFDIYHLYQRTFLYRDLKLRGAILQSGQLIILPQEQVFNRVNGVWNLSSDQGNLGCFVVSNIRVVWYADANETFNISLPYMQIASIRIRESKYGPALVIQTAETGGGYVLGFRIDPPERLTEIFKELISLHSIFTENPNFGIIYETSGLDNSSSSAAVQRKEIKIEEFQEIDERQEKEINSKLNTYLAEGSLAVGEEKPPREPVYCKELGFAMERIRDGYKLKDLWDVLPQQMIVIEEE